MTTGLIDSCSFSLAAVIWARLEVLETMAGLFLFFLWRGMITWHQLACIDTKKHKKKCPQGCAKNPTFPFVTLTVMFAYQALTAL